MDKTDINKNDIKHTTTTSVIHMNENRKEKMATIFALGLEAFKVFMACMLSLFVSQKCKDHDCSLSEKFNEETLFARSVLACNFVTLFVFLIGYNIEYMREQYIIHHFNDNPKLADNNIIDILKPYPQLASQLQLWNKRFYYITIGSVGIGITNFIASGIFICTTHYNGMRTVTSLVTNILLVSNTVNSNYKISKKCHNKMLALSSSRLEPLCYNDLDKRVRGKLILANAAAQSAEPTTIDIPETPLSETLTEVPEEKEESNEESQEKEDAVGEAVQPDEIKVNYVV